MPAEKQAADLTGYWASEATHTFYSLTGPLDECLALEPVSYRARVVGESAISPRRSVVSRSARLPRKA